MALTDTPSTQVFIGLGSNMNEPLVQLKGALAALRSTPGLTNISCSSVYQTTPMGPADQLDYINAVVQCDTTLSASRLLDRMQLIENRAGRVKDRQWGPRSLDLDLLLYGQQVINTLRLTVPHAGIAERSFVLYPLADLAPSLDIPGKGKLSDLLDRCPQLGISQLQSSL
ncbi:MAG: 2-amino-4-hydroxy-6-hydroxymethyldihydropteridine diphosphokinase [Granulosicoccaceae bacterium]